MTPELYQQVDEIFQTALELHPEQRAAYLDGSCGNDATLRGEVESLLNFDGGPSPFLDSPAFDLAAPLLAGDQSELLAGSRIDRYEIRSLIGRGGMGEVYLAHDERLGRDIALKLLPADFITDQERLRRFQLEARAASALNHPNIITIHELGEVDKDCFIATEFVAGQTLRERMRQSPMSLPESLSIAVQVCSALSAAHQAGIVHRDIKPDNIMLRPDGYIKVLDFGLAKLNEESQPRPQFGSIGDSGLSDGLIMGTLKYMSPEQARGLEIDARTDVFSLGTVLYEMVTGRTPLDGDEREELLASLLSDETAPMEEVPSRLRAVLSRALKKNRDERYETAADFLIDLQQVKDELPEGSRTRWSNFPTVWLLAGVLVVIIGLITGIQLARRNRTVAPTPPATQRKSVAVLPFKSIGGEPSEDYLRLGIADAIITKLTGLREITVRPLASVAKYGARDQDPIAAGKELGVDVVLDGQIHRAGDRYRVTVQLWQVSDAASLSSYSCDDACARIFELQDSISQRAADTLALRLTAQEQAYLAKRYTQNKDVYDLYLRGRYHFDKHTREGYEKSIDYFNEAVKLEPGYAPAFAGLSDANSQLAWFDSTTSTQFVAKAREAANRALEIDDNLAEVHTSMATIKFMYDWNWPGARAEFERAIALKPNYALAWNMYSFALAYVGEFDRALEASQKEFELDPLSVTANFDRGAIYVYTQRTDEAIRQLEKVIEMKPDLNHAHHFLLNAYYQKGMHDRFIEKLIAVRSDPVLANHGDWSAIGLSPNEIREVYSARGWDGFLRGELERVLVRSNNERVSPKRIAVLYAMLGENDQALQWLEKTYQEHSKTTMTIRVDPRLQRLRPDPRFRELLRRVGLS